MLRKNKITQFLSLSIIVLSFAITSFTPVDSWSKSRGLGRIRGCDPQGNHETLDFDPRTSGKDSEFVLSNPVCIGVIAYTYAITKVAIAIMNRACNSGSGVPRILPSPFKDSIDITKATVKTVGNAQCAAGYASAITSFSTSMALLRGIYEKAKNTFRDARICGSQWVSPNPKQYLINSPNYKALVEQKVEEYLNDDTLRGDNLNFSNKYYREWYYGGVEVADNPSNGNYCKDVTLEKTGGSYPAQKYYMKGYETANYNCKKYDILEGQNDPRTGEKITQARLREFKQAYNCCIQRSQNYICISYKGEKKFCKAGSRCKLGIVYFSARYHNNRGMVCAESYSLCPYNFYLGGGSEECDYFQDGILNSGGRYDYITLKNIEDGDCARRSEIRNPDCTYNNKAGKCKNYCQYMRHCTKVNNAYKHKNTEFSPYFSYACLNFVGDSQNVLKIKNGYIAGSARHFSTPIAQCFRETLENVFYNRAGHTRCLLEDQIPDSFGNCENGTAYKEGEKVSDKSFFETLQSELHVLVKLILTISITFWGMKILIASEVPKKKDLIVYITQIAIVMFFATGSAWQQFFFDGVYKASNEFSKIVFKIQIPDAEEKRDGCQFGKITDSNGNDLPSTITYPKDKEYLAIWDSLDCKISRYMDFGPEMSTAGIAKLILAGFLTGAVGVYFSISLFFFAFLMISATIRALHIFLASSMAIIILVFISPITITAILFKKTENIFKGWVKQLIGFSLQPMILFAYLAIFISILDTTLTGSATFYGTPPVKSIKCSKYCVDMYGEKVTSDKSPNCDKLGEKIIDPKSDSFACLINGNDFGSWPGLELIGISIPFIIEIFSTNAKDKILTVIKGAIVIYFLSKFMDEIPGIAKQLVGGGKLPSSTKDAVGMVKGFAGLLRGVQKRANRAGLNAAKGGVRGGIKGAKGLAKKMGKKGKSVDDNKKAMGTSSDEAGDSEGSQGNSVDSAGDSSGGSNDSAEDSKDSSSKDEAK